MSVEATEIPKLRAHFIDMTCSQSKLKRRAELEKILIDAQEPLMGKIRGVFDTYLEAEVLGIIGKIKAVKAKNTYITAAKRKLEAYSRWPAATQKVFCSNNGSWETKKVGKVDWNAEMTQALLKDVEVDLRRWDDVSSNLTKELSEAIVGIAHNLIAQLGDAAGPSRGVLKVFFDELVLQSEELSTKCKEVAERFERELGIIKDGISTNYFVEAMAETYERSAKLSGPGVRQKRIELLQEKLSEKGIKNPFHEVHNKAKSASQKLPQQCIGEFHDAVLHIFQGFHATFMRSFKTDEADSPEAKALRERLRSRLPAWRNMLTEIDRLIQECEESAKRA
ncbi:hypothetical protein GTA08_BOTSDO11563 [Neofusicoccum parvum]|nr:hypothetical protein GTA08_BOTSDO11563 [Neofusicoccum parvum]